MQNIPLSEFNMKNRNSVLVFSIKNWAGEISETEEACLAVAYGDHIQLLWQLCNLIVYLVDQNINKSTKELEELIRYEAMEQTVSAELTLCDSYNIYDEGEVWIAEDLQSIRRVVSKFLDEHAEAFIEPIREQLKNSQAAEPFRKQSIEFNLLTLTPFQKAIQLTFF